MWEHVSDSARDLLKHMLVVDPSQRWTAEELLEHLWFQVRAGEEGGATLEPGPEEGAGAGEEEGGYMPVPSSNASLWVRVWAGCRRRPRR